MVLRRVQRHRCGLCKLRANGRWRHAPGRAAHRAHSEPECCCAPRQGPQGVGGRWGSAPRQGPQGVGGRGRRRVKAVKVWAGEAGAASRPSRCGRAAGRWGWRPWGGSA
eukprot:313276-Chlamydomonas_euryale.AAC.2